MIELFHTFQMSVQIHVASLTGALEINLKHN